MAEALKDQFFQEDFLNSLSKDIHRIYTPFDVKVFLSALNGDKWQEASLTQRMRLISHALRHQLPDDYPEAIDILLKVYHRYTGFDGMVFPDFVQVFGLEHYESSMHALGQFTKCSSSEFAIRPFILQEEQKTMDKLLHWSKSDSLHLRRLASEGCRPRLPWAMALSKFKKDPAPIFPVLENLMDDEAEYVRKSVANNLNDIAKDNSQLVLDFLTDYKNSNSKNTQWIIKQALRTLIKNGDVSAMHLLGYEKSNVGLSNFKLSSDQIGVHDTLQFSFDLQNPDGKPQDLIIDYIVHYVKSNGSTAPKVFKLTTCTLMPKEKLSFNGRVRFTEMTTRKHYPGKHKIEVQVNGKILGSKSFELLR